MKTFIVLALALGFTTANAAGLTRKSTYAIPHEAFIALTQEECTADVGKWNADYEACEVQTEDTVEVTSTRTGKATFVHEVEIATTSGSGNFCLFESEKAAVAGPGDTIIASVKGEDVFNGGEIECKVTLTFKNTSVSVTSSFNECALSTVCGANAQLDMADVPLKSSQIIRPLNQSSNLGKGKKR